TLSPAPSLLREVKPPPHPPGAPHEDATGTSARVARRLLDEGDAADPGAGGGGAGGLPGAPGLGNRIPDGHRHRPPAAAVAVAEAVPDQPAARVSTARGVIRLPDPVSGVGDRLVLQVLVVGHGASHRFRI